MFINVSNHPHALWSAEQTEAARRCGQLVTLPFPEIDPAADTHEIREIAQEFHGTVCHIAQDAGEPLEQVTVMVSGEFTCTYHLVTLLKQSGIRVVAACSRRDVLEQVQPDGSVVKKARFRFVQFREY